MLIKEITKEKYLCNEILKNHIELFDKIHDFFKPEDDVIFLKAPGRVNIIGEHTDYNMCPVLPCAVDKEIIFCIKKSKDDKIILSNVNTEFQNIEFNINTNIQPYEKGFWGNYVKAGILGIKNYLKEDLIGFQGVVSSNIPSSAGMSSSSALVVCSSVSLLNINNKFIDKLKLAKICADSEHFVGTAGGGMDQTASINGIKNSLIKIDFNPIKITPAKLPDNYSIVVSNSLIKAEKTKGARFSYNKRVIECNLGVDLFKKYLDENNIQIKSFNSMKYIGDITEEKTGIKNNQLEIIINNYIESLKNEYTAGDIIQILNITEDEFIDKYLKRNNEFIINKQDKNFKIKQRFRHVFSEWKRVEQAIITLKNNNIKEFGKLMTDSQNSMDKDYEISTIEINKLVENALSYGATGSRLTGAGFGGCVVNIVEKSKIDSFIQGLKDTYYNFITKENPEIELSENDIIVCNPENGAGEISLK